MHHQVHQYPSLHPDCTQRQKLLLCCQRRLLISLVQSFALLHCRWNRRHYYVLGKSCHLCSDCIFILSLHLLRAVCQTELSLTILTSSGTLFLIKVVAIIGYLVGMLFMSVYTIAMDTLLQCFIVDETNQKAKGKGKPQWAPEDLANLMDIEE